MPYSIETEDGIVIDSIPDDVAPDSQVLKDRVASIRANRGSAQTAAPQEAPGGSPVSAPISPAPEVAPQQESPGVLRGLIEGAKDVARDVREAVTGTRRSAAPDVATALAENRTIYDMPEANQLSFGMLKSALGGITAGSEERAKIFAANFPGLTYRLDEQGTVFLRSPTDGNEYVIEPGLTVQDVPHAALMALLFTPAGRAVSIPAAIKAGGATQAAIEMSQQETGGEFNPVEVLAAAATGPAGQVLQRVGTGLKNVVQKLRGKVPPVIASGFSPGAPTVATDITGDAVDSLAGVPKDLGPVEIVDNLGGFRDAPRVAPNVPPINPMSAEELASTARTAAKGGFGSDKATKVLAKEAALDPELVKAAKNLGIIEYLQPDHLTTNQAFREMAQAVKSVPGSTTRASEIEGLVQVGKRADDLIAEIGGMTDLSQMSQEVRTNLAGTVDTLVKSADKAYLNLKKNVPPTATGAADNVLNFIKNRVKDLGGKKEDLSKLEKYILNALSPIRIKPKPNFLENLRNKGLIIPFQESDLAQKVVKYKLPTYTLMDDVRVAIGRATEGEGPFKDAETGAAKNLYKLIEGDQFALANKFNYGTEYRAAKDLVSVRKGVEDDMISLFGRQLDQSLVGKLATATTSLSKGDGDKLVKILTAIPESIRPMAAASALNTAFGKSTQNGTLNFNTYANWYEGLKKNKQAYAALMNNLPPTARRSLSDLYKVSNGIRMATRERITTGRLQVVQEALQGADSLMNNIFGVARRVLISAPIEGFTSIIGLPGAGLAAGLTSALNKSVKPDVIKKADELISSPLFIRLVTGVATEAPVTNPIRRVAMSKEFRRFADAAKLPKTLDARIQWIQSAMQTERQLSPDEQSEPQTQPVGQ